MTLREIINGIETFSDEHVIFASKNEDRWELEDAAALVLISDMENIGTSLEDLHYFLEIEIAKEVLDVWRQWRNERLPDEKERIEALIFYSDNDAYLP